MDLKEIGNVNPSDHWYYRTKYLFLRDFITPIISKQNPLNIIDIGAGSGFFSGCIMDQFPNTINDVQRVDSAYPTNTAQSDPRIHGQLLQRTECLSSIENACVLLMDVLEHVPDDAAFLRSITTRCKGNVNFFITVPAFMSLWSAHDEYLEHYRRYALSSLQACAQTAGIKVVHSYYVYGLLFPFVWLIRKVKGIDRTPASDMQPMPKIISLLLEILCRCEFPFRRLNKFFGVTCILEGVI